MHTLNGASVLITGGTGSFGKALARELLHRYPGIRRLIIFSRDELKQYEMSCLEPFRQYQQAMRYFIGDVRDYGRLKRALEDVDYVVHAAALKQLAAAEYNPMECIKTNVLGAENIINAALENNVKKVIALSTDKASGPVSLYGATKLCSDKLFTAANNIKGKRDITFSVVRYGNVMGSRGSVIPFFLQKKQEGVLPLSDKRMTRFNITLQECVQMVLWSLEHAIGGEIFIPKIPSYSITDLAEAIGPECRHEEVGGWPGEKIHEEMVPEADARYTLDAGNLYIITPFEIFQSGDIFKETFGAKEVPEGFSYNSGNNDQWLSIENIRNLIKEHVDPEFAA